ncbi:MAG: hypothetical protein QNK82_13210 [Akkermansiaceae bacterium]|jgi:hypothetical protein|nr:hypothetical protein [bacterium]|tara:strand:+ start:375 stop:938 length:564 start_codon:yes stop_codon:yes gene_type:complete
MENLKRSGAAIAGLLVLVCCRNAEVSEGDGADDSKEALKVEASTRNRRLSGGSERSESGQVRIAGFVSKLKKISDYRERRDLFSEILLNLPNDEHDFAVEVVIDDLNSEDPANLVSEYLEISSLMSPALQLPGIVRLLEEPKLLPLQRTAMEQQLRQDIGIPPDQSVSDWRLLVGDHLRKNKALISE